MLAVRVQTSKDLEMVESANAFQAEMSICLKTFGKETDMVFRSFWPNNNNKIMINLRSLWVV